LTTREQAATQIGFGYRLQPLAKPSVATFAEWLRRCQEINIAMRSTNPAYTQKAGRQSFLKAVKEKGQR